MKFGKMKPHRRNRLLLVAFIVVSSGVAVTLGLMALNENINLFYEPEQIVRGEAPPGQMIRAGGMVKTGSIQRSKTDLKVTFVVTDLRESEFTMQYEGVLPDLFREGQGVIAQGALNEDGIFMASEVLAKHDENYMAPEVSGVLAKAHNSNSGANNAAPENPKVPGEEVADKTL